MERDNAWRVVFLSLKGEKNTMYTISLIVNDETFKEH